MRGIRFEASGHAHVVPLPEPEPRPGEVVVAVTSTGVCGSDLAALRGTHIFRKPPLISGHEVGGTIAAIGQGVQDIAVGDHVVVDPQKVCGECTKCTSGRYHLCPHKQMLGITEWDGSFADYVRVPDYTVIKAPEDIAPEHLALAEPLAVAAHAVGRAALEPGSRALVLGGGTIGALITQVLSAQGAGHVDVVEPREFLGPVLRGMGAGGVFTPDDFAATSTEPYDAVFVAAGVADLVRTAFARITTGGTIVQVAVFNTDVQVPVGELQVKEVAFLGTAMYVRRDFVTALEILDRFPDLPERIVSRTVTLEEGATIINDMRDNGPGDILKLVMVP
jgi:L-iditol 2-dehydrogenase